MTTQRQIKTSLIILILFITLSGIANHPVQAQDLTDNRIYIDGSIEDQQLLKTVSEAGSLAEFTALICLEDDQNKNFEIVWSMDKTGGPNCTMNPPKTGIFAEMKGSHFNVPLGGPGQTPLPEQVIRANKDKLHIFIFVSVNEEDWRLIVPAGYQYNNLTIPTVSASINITYHVLDHQTLALR